MLPRTCHPGALAARGARLCGALPVNDLRRLASAVDRVEGPVRVDLEFGRDDSGLASIRGRLESAVQLTCQRCLEPLDLVLRVEVDVLVVHSQREPEWRGQTREVVYVQDDSLPLQAMIEDELLLSLPMHAVHRRGRCSPPPSPPVPNGGTASSPPNPFAALADLDKPATH